MNGSGLQDIKNIKAAISMPKIPSTMPTLRQPSISALPMAPPTFNHQQDFRRPADNHTSKTPPPSLAKLDKKDFSLVDFSKNKVIKNDSLFRKDFRFKTRNALKGTLKRYADRNKVANLLWDKRGYGGITKAEVKSGLRKLEASGKLNYGQVRAVRRKLKVY